VETSNIQCNQIVCLMKCEEFLWLYCITWWNKDSLVTGRDPAGHAIIHSCLLFWIAKDFFF